MTQPNEGKVLWLIVGIPATIAFIATPAAWISFKSSAPNYSLGDGLGFWGLWAGCFGLLATFAGFGLTFVQLQRTQTAAVAVAQAVTRIQKDYGAFDILRELRAVTTEVQSARKALEFDRYEDARNSYDSLRVSLMRMASAGEVLSDANRDELKDSAARAKDAYKTISDQIGSETENIPKTEMISQLQDLDNLMITLEAELKDQIHAG